MPTVALRCGRCGKPVGEADQYCLHCGRQLLRRAPVVDRVEVRGHLRTARGTFGRAPLSPRLSAHLVDLALTVTLGFVIWVVYFADYRRGYNVGLEVAIASVVLGIVVACNAAGWSPGKRAVGIRIVTDDGRRPGLLRGTLRLVLAIGGLIPLGYGHLAAARHPDARAWHDRLTGTHAVWTEDTPIQHATPRAAARPDPPGGGDKISERPGRLSIAGLRRKRTSVLIPAARHVHPEGERRTQWSPPRSSPSPSR